MYTSNFRYVFAYNKAVLWQRIILTPAMYTCWWMQNYGYNVIIV